MVRQMLKLIWRRKRANGFLVAEIMLTFFVLFVIVSVFLDASERYRRPNGFTIENVLNITAHETGATTNMRQQAPVFSRLVLALEDFGEVADVGLAGWYMYKRSMNIGTYDIEGGRKVRMNQAYLSDTCRDILNLQLVRGRWFDVVDDGAQDTPVVINEKLAREMFGDEDPLGKTFRRDLRIIGVISDYRLYGEFDELRNLVIERIVLSPADTAQSPSQVGAILVRLNRPDTAELNARILVALQAVEPSWTYTITPAEDLHDAYFRQSATPYLMAGASSAALVAMVMLGLLGVLWQNITGRTREIGLRRAKGATIGNIYTQIIGEMLIVATAGILPGIAIVSQLLMMDTLGFIPLGTHLVAMSLAAVGLYGMVVLCSLYPGYMAMRINPAEALRYE